MTNIGRGTSLILILSWIAGSGGAVAVADEDSKTIMVDCTKGKSINAALADRAAVLTVEIRGICQEDVEVRRDNVVLRGASPSEDGVQGLGAGSAVGHAVVRVREARNVRIENLLVTGGARNGIGVEYSGGVEVDNCRILDNAHFGVAGGKTASVQVANTELRGNGSGGIGGFGGFLACSQCTIAGSGTGVLATEGTRISITDSTISGQPGVNALSFGQIVLVRSDIQGDLLATRFGYVQWTIGEFSGNLWVDRKGLADLNRVVQLASPFDSAVGIDSTLQAKDSSLRGLMSIGTFAKLVLQGTSQIDGDLRCLPGGDAFCPIPAPVSGAVTGCTLCTKP